MNGFHESVFAGEGVGALKTSVNRLLLRLTARCLLLLSTPRGDRQAPLPHPRSVFFDLESDT